MFLIVNISSVQLISVNIIAYRSQYGSANPSEVIGPSLLATCVSTVRLLYSVKSWKGEEEVEMGFVHIRFYDSSYHIWYTDLRTS